MVDATLAGAGVAFAFLFLYRFRMVFLSASVGVVLAAATRPIMVAVGRRGVRREFGALLAFALLSSVAVGIAVLAVPRVVEQVSTVAARVPDYYAELRDWLAHSSSRFVRHAVEHLPAHLDVTRNLTPMTAEQIVALVQRLGSAAIMAVAVILFAFYWTIGGERSVQVLARLAPFDRRDEVRAFINDAESRLGSYVRAQLLVCVTVGALAFSAYLIIGVPNAIVFALLAALLELVPVVGPTIGNVPAFLIMLAIHPARAPWVIAAALAIQLVENYVLFPRFMGKSAGVHPLTCLLAIVACGTLLGILGVFLAVPIAVVLQLVFERFVARKDEIAPPVGRDRCDLLRYDARTLVADAHRLAEAPAVAGHAELRALTEEIEAMASALDLLVPGELTFAPRDERAGAG